jgi:signal transduction histidine kinase
MSPSREAAPSARLLTALGALCVALTGLNLWLGLAYGARAQLFVVSDVAVGACFAATGVAAWRLRPRSRIGLLMLILGIALLIDNPYGFALPAEMPGRQLIILVGEPVYWLQYALAAHLFLSYPSGQLKEPIERRMITASYLLAIIGGVFLLMTRTDSFICGHWCGQLTSHQLEVQARSAVMLAWTGLATIVIAVLVSRFIRSGPRQRYHEGFALAVAGLTVFLFMALFVITMIGADGGDEDGPANTGVLHAVMSWTAVIAMPVAFLVGLLRERLEFASVGDLVGGLKQVTPDTVEAALSQTLRDPTLRVAFPTTSGWLDVSGHHYNPPSDGSRSLALLGDPPFAALVYDPTLAEHRDLLNAAASAARLALDNARLYAEVRAQLDEVRSSRQRLAAAADEERQRLERDLHDGAQQRLLGVGLKLGVLRGRLDGTAEQTMVNELEQELRTAIRELRDLAQGIRPAVLTDQGLAPALAGLTRRAGVRVDLDMRLAKRLDPTIEVTAYYVVSEALQNVVKHTHNAAVHVSAIHEAGRLIVEVADEGPGEASMLAGTGLRGLADRVEAVGGCFEINSPPRGGTLIRAELPCA